MAKGLLGRKVGMTQIFNEAGEVVPVTVIEAGPCVVLQVRTQERDGYEAVQLGFGERSRRRARRSERGHVADINSKRQRSRQAAGVELVPRAETEPKKYIREFRTDGEDHGYEVGQTVGVGLFSEIRFVDVIGTTKGRGTAGVMKRHNHSGQPASHGAKKVHRQAGSTGNSTDPGKVLKGTKMAGRYGNDRVTVRNLTVVRVDEENNMLLVYGAIPGPNGGFVIIRETNKR